MQGIKLPLLATALAIAITATMDFTGYLMFSALPLAGLILIFWLLQRQSRAEVGLRLGAWGHYGLAVAYPAVVLGAATLVAFLSGSIDLTDANWRHAGMNVGVGSSVGVLMLLLTEEGFFRGWLWGAFRRGGLGPRQTLLATGALFTLWHISAVTSGTDYGLPWAQIPVYLANALMLGLIWGLMRMVSGSVIVASLSHAVWNAFAYTLFGFGTKVGELGIANTALLGPEVGFLGWLLNGAFLWWLYTRAKRSGHLA